MARAPGQPAPHDIAIGCPLGRGRHRVRLAAGGQAQPYPAFAGKVKHRAERFALAQFAASQAIIAHDDLVAGAERAPIQDAGHFQRLGVGPHVWWSDAGMQKGRSGRMRQMMARHPPRRAR